MNQNRVKLSWRKPKKKKWDSFFPSILALLKWWQTFKRGGIMKIIFNSQTHSTKPFKNSSMKWSISSTSIVNKKRCLISYTTTGSLVITLLSSASTVRNSECIMQSRKTKRAIPIISRLKGCFMDILMITKLTILNEHEHERVRPSILNDLKS